MIYFIQDGSLFYIKIGYTGADDALERLRALQTGNPSGLVLLATMPGTAEDEKRLHERFSHLRAQGEWFRPGTELIKFLVETASRQAVVNQGAAIVRRPDWASMAVEADRPVWLNNVPVGTYDPVKFLGVKPLKHESSFLGPDGYPYAYGASCEWRFEISLGKYAGYLVGSVTEDQPTTINRCGRILTGILGRRPRFDEDVIPNDSIGRFYRAFVTCDKLNPDRPYVISVKPSVREALSNGVTCKEFLELDLSDYPSEPTS